MMRRQNMLLMLLLAVAGFGAWTYFSKSGRALVSSAGGSVSEGVQKLADLADSTLQLVKRFEGFSPTPYRDARGWSIGYGHYMGPQPTMQSISESDAYDLLRSDVQTASDAVKATIGTALSQNQFDALVSFAYNVGINAFRNSTLARKVNAGDMTGAANEFARWNKSNGSVLQALVDRRDAEAQLFLTG